MRNKNVLSLRRSLPTMSWSPKNLYNLWRRTVGPKSSDMTFKLTTEETLFQQRWKSKAAVRAYHGDFIPEKSFKRWYLPDTLPDVRPRRQVVSGDALSLEEFAKRNVREKELEREIEEKGLAPVGSLMFTEVERRMDVFVFRCCFVHSVYEARRLIIHGYVKLNGKKHTRANTRLAPGDMVSVDPAAIRFFKTPHGDFDDVNNLDIHKKPSEVTAEAEAEESSNEGPKPPDTGDAVEGKSDATHAALLSTITSTQPSTELTPFYLPPYASPWLFIPAYIEVSFKTCSAVYVRHPTARPGYSEIPTPYDADGALIRYAWEWYVQRRPRMRSASKLARAPEDRVVNLLKSLHKDRRMLWAGWALNTKWKNKEQPPHMPQAPQASDIPPAEATAA
ncbi:hypothetical protein NLJ89_g10724 [Agrocybe chaxingu]|uniref:RNA-binding S4 domain-containing protein n=1 Tax=Agrocybe chaxingu TaxID=84603 RepID=A0A9W8JR93_9AGAR|nr:hypothetical protein NLJ89_g10724 [Agrocybe chaxingu]